MLGRFVPSRRATGCAGRRPTAALRLERLEERATPAALTPAQIRHAYGFDQVTLVTAPPDGSGADREDLGPSKSAPPDGRGTTIAIVDAYNDPYAFSDLQ